MKRQTTLLILPLILAGCVSTPAPPDSSPSHPANPQAPQSAYPPPTPFLMVATNLVMTKPATEAAPEHQHGHGQHEAEPKQESTK